jgi:hypothetical protein
LCGAEAIKTAAAGQCDEAVTGDWAKKDLARKKNTKYVMQGTVFDFGTQYGLRILKPISLLTKTSFSTKSAIVISMIS